ncbi:TolC family protein [Pelagicoccus sp. SDUM812003]|uniref:TolC family protein n=1 Tax=Pelagicoccus sp. SDUM812003 TaxID=3041267 RepID=UPI00280F130A|nr:TolC family protein [Pelagicoccus sp. SDUM812003]MDQ8202054.1 TolC family protein [Pelagicoccus sp. SDUM812003]
MIRHSHSIKTMKAHTLILAIASCLSLTAYGQDPISRRAQSLSSDHLLGSYILEALENNPSLQAAESRYEAARASIDSARALPDPKLQITHFVESIQTRTGPQRQAISLQQPIPWLGKLDRMRDMAQAESESLWHAYAQQQFTLVDDVAEQGLEIAYLDQTIEITRQNVALLRRLESVVENKVKSGGELSDLLKLQVEIQRFQDLAAKQETQRFAAEVQLASLLGRNDGPAVLNAPLREPDPISADLELWLSTIKERSPQLAMLRSLESGKSARERLAQYASKPDFSVGVNYIRTGDALNPATPGSGKDPWAVMVGVSLPIWGKANNAISLRASLEKEAIQAEIRSLELQLESDGRAWIARLEDAQDRIQRYQTQLLPLARQAQEITEAGYQSGKASILDLIDSDRALLSLETEYWRVVADCWLARWKLATLSGGLWLD